MSLLRGAARRGAAPFARQVHLTVLNAVVRHKHLVFYASAEDLLALPMPQAEDVTFREIPSWEDFTPDVRKRLRDKDEGISWGEESWFENGWRLWAAEVEGRTASVTWWRDAPQSQDFFCPMPPDTELLWQAATFPEFRGRGLHVSLLLSLMQTRCREGVEGFFCNCRDFNYASHRNILKLGFRPVGHFTDSRITGRRSWHPTASTDKTT